MQVDGLRRPLQSDRLRLEQLSVEVADEMVEVLSDPVLYEFTGGEPPSLSQLKDRYRRQAVGHSSDGAQIWCNWIAHRRADNDAVGTVQATLIVETGAAEIAWVIGAPWQGQGYGREAAHTLLSALRAAGVARVIAHIHPDHQASQAIASHLGMQLTGRVIDGEQEWAIGLVPTTLIE